MVIFVIGSVDAVPDGVKPRPPKVRAVPSWQHAQSRHVSWLPMAEKLS
jgi:hypothetical protein